MPKRIKLGEEKDSLFSKINNKRNVDMILREPKIIKKYLQGQESIGLLPGAVKEKCPKDEMTDVH